MIDVKVPSVGESVTSGILAVWLKAEGEYIAEGEDLFELETDKATMPIPAPSNGLLHITVTEGTEVTIDQVVATIDETKTGSSATPEALSPPASSTPVKPQAASTASQPAETKKVTPLSTMQEPGSHSPAVRRHLAETGLKASQVQGSGKDGRITKADIFSQSVAPKAAERQTRVPMSTLRKRIAANLLHSKHNAAHLTTVNEVDMSRVIALRAQYKEEFEKVHSIRLGFMGFFIKAVQHALQTWPSVNAFLDGTDIVYNNYYNINIAVSTEVGLVIPVLRDVDTMGLADIERNIADLGKRARERKLMPDEFVGGTFTISNGGVFGSMLSTPIPSPSQTAILGMHSIQKRAVVVNDEIVIRPMMYLALSYDHQVIDGREAIGFLVDVKNAVQDPERMLLGL